MLLDGQIFGSIGLDLARPTFHWVWSLEKVPVLIIGSRWTNGSVLSFFSSFVIPYTRRSTNADNPLLERLPGASAERSAVHMKRRDKCVTFCDKCDTLSGFAGLRPELLRV
jgi:hypothetical protein